MSDLSVAAAARDQPDGLALIDGDRTYSFAELAALAQGDRQTSAARSRTLIAPRANAEDIARLLGWLDRREPFVLAHARWTRAEVDSVAARASVSIGWLDGNRVDFSPQPSIEARKPSVREQVLVPTSGSSGRPKLVRLGHRALSAAAAAHAAALPWTRDDRWVLTLPLGHIGGLSILTRSLYARRPVIIGPPRFQAEEVLACIARHAGTFLSVVPAMLAQLITLPVPRSLRAVLVGGAASSPDLIERARAHGWPVLPTYGASETAAQVCTQRLGDERSRGVGPPLPGTEVRIREGRIEVRGPTLMDGYLDDPAPWVEGWFRTEDLGRLDEEGHLHILGRAGERIITGGENVDPTEVEAAIAAHPGISEVAVMGRPDPVYGERVVAVIAGPNPPDLEGLIGFLRTTLARFKQPRGLEVRESLPRLPSGKLDRRQLRGSMCGSRTPSTSPT